jgi:hypothetical protein
MRRVERARRPVRTLPPLLDRLIHAEEHRGEPDRAAALAALGQMALVTIPTSGVIAPADDEQLYMAIESIARQHLGFTVLREAIKSALGRIADFDDRDAIETAYNASRAVSDQVYFYAGLAFGVTVARFGDSSWR